jgi:hypothetical protein
VIDSYQYTRIEDLITSINQKIFATIPGQFSVVLATTNPLYLLQFICNSAASSIQFIDGILFNFILGFQKIIKVSNFIQTSVTSNIPYNLNHETYFSFYIQEIADVQQNQNPKILGQFKIPLINSHGSILYYSQSFYQNIIESSIAYQINDKISIQFFDKYGFAFSMDDLGFSFSLLFSEIMR